MAKRKTSGYLSEIFASIQGEGIYTGVLQLFVRFAGCRLSCDYCDTRYAAQRTKEFIVRAPGGETREANPVGASKLASIAASIASGLSGLHSVSVTGGEPLEQPYFLADILERLKGKGLKTYLETNGQHEEGARLAGGLADIVSLDIKLPSLCGGRSALDVYKRVLPHFTGKEIFIKVVVAGGFSRSEFSKAVSIMSGFDRSIPFVIQPATPVGRRPAPEPQALLSLYDEASRTLDNVRVIPQCHRIAGLR